MSNRSKLDEFIQGFQQARRDLEEELDRQLDERREQFNYTLKKGKVNFDQQVAKLLRKERIGSIRYILNTPLAFLITSPVIYGMIFPLMLLDLSITLYQHICFRVYKVPRVTRSDYITVDRHRLPYLNAIQKINCVYCGYGNGLLAYATEVIARTEQYWCPIKHAQRLKGLHTRTDKFMEYGDAEAWRNELQVIRCDWEDNQDKDDKTS